MPSSRVVVPLARPGFITAAILGFAHTVGEFGVVLMIGGNIPGKTRVLSMQIYDHVEALEYAQAHWLAGGMLVFSFVVLLVLYAFKPAAAQSAMSIARRASASHCPGFALDVDLDLPGPRRHRAVRPFRLRQDHAAALHRRAGTRAERPAVDQRRGLAGRRHASCPTHQRPLGYVFQEASLFPHLTRARQPRLRA